MHGEVFQWNTVDEGDSYRDMESLRQENASLLEQLRKSENKVRTLESEIDRHRERETGLQAELNQKTAQLEQCRRWNDVLQKSCNRRHMTSPPADAVLGEVGNAERDRSNAEVDQDHSPERASISLSSPLNLHSVGRGQLYCDQVQDTGKSVTNRITGGGAQVSVTPTKSVDQFDGQASIRLGSPAGRSTFSVSPTLVPSPDLVSSPALSPISKILAMTDAMSNDLEARVHNDNRDVVFSPVPDLEPDRRGSVITLGSENMPTNVSPTMASVPPIPTVSSMQVSNNTPTTASSSSLSSAPAFLSSEEESTDPNNEPSNDQPTQSRTSSANMSEGDNIFNQRSMVPGKAIASSNAASLQDSHKPLFDDGGVGEERGGFEEQDDDDEQDEGEKEEQEQGIEVEEEKEEEGEEKEDSGGNGTQRPRGGRRRSKVADLYPETTLDAYDKGVSNSGRCSESNEDRRASAEVGSGQLVRKARRRKHVDLHPLANRLQPSCPNIETIKQEIVQSYRDCGLQPNIVFTAVKAPYEPSSITIAGRWRDAKLTPKTMQRLRARRDELLKSWKGVNNTDKTCNGEERDVDLIRKLCESPMIRTEATGFLSAMRKFCRQGNTTHDQMRLFDFWKWSALCIAHQEDMHHEYEAAYQIYNESAKAEDRNNMPKIRTRGHIDELLSLCSCLHFVLARLNERWRGLHYIVLVRLLRAGNRLLLEFFGHLTRPVAVQLLLKSFNDDSVFAEANTSHMRSLMSRAFPYTNPALEHTAPLGHLQAELVEEKLSGTTVSSSLGYSNEREYWARAVVPATASRQNQTPERDLGDAARSAIPTPFSGPARRDFATQRKRVFPDVGGSDVERTPKRSQTNRLAKAGKTSMNPRERANVQLLADSDTTDTSHFRFRGALASTSEGGGSDSETSVSPTKLGTPPLTYERSDTATHS